MTWSPRSSPVVAFPQYWCPHPMDCLKFYSSKAR
ncbi:hypothetical protein SLEP1_g46619 [Rubroshorea leprosula]|nr:hypothetical protein SLEP1_g46619 [Rubroshorea leprosula]